MATNVNRRGFVSGAGLLLGQAALWPVVSRAQVINGGGPATGTPRPALPRDGRSHLVMLGTRGGPGVDLSRSQTASALVIDGTPYLVDCGYGALRQLVASGVGFQLLDNIFLTHLHDDHTADLVALLDFQWTNSKTSLTNVHGPAGTERLVAAAVSVLELNAEIRQVDEGRAVAPRDRYKGHDIPAGRAPAIAYKDDRVTVTAVENTHYPARSTARMAHRSLALRFDARDRSIVFSGDTAYSENLVALAKGADVLVCEIMDKAVHAQMAQRAKEAEAVGNAESIFRHVAETHSQPSDVARMATAAGVRTVVLYHLLPGANPAGGVGWPVSTFIDDVHQGFAGEVIVGQDLMVL